MFHGVQRTVDSADDVRKCAEYTILMSNIDIRDGVRHPLCWSRYVTCYTQNARHREPGVKRKGSGVFLEVEVGFGFISEPKLIRLAMCSE